MLTFSVAAVVRFLKSLPLTIVAATTKIPKAVGVGVAVTGSLRAGVGWGATGIPSSAVGSVFLFSEIAHLLIVVFVLVLPAAKLYSPIF